MQAIQRLDTGWVFLIALTGLTLIPAPFFSDQGTLLSYPAQFYLEHDFKLILPVAHDTGHPPLPPLFLAAFWLILGKTLFITKVALLPVVFATGVFFLKLVKHFLDGPAKNIALILFLFQPTILAHTVSPGVEPFIWCFTLAAIWFGIKSNRIGYVLSLAFLMLCSHRGLVIAGSVWLSISFFDITFKSFRLKDFLKKIPSFILAVVPIICWHIYHYANAGWTMSHEGSPWIEHRGFLSPTDMLFSAGMFSFRLFEFGMGLIWLIYILALFRGKLSPKLKFWNGMLLILLLSLGVALIPFANPISNRYLLIIQLAVILPAAYIIAGFRRKWSITLFLILVLSSSHFYTYNELWSKRIGYAHDATLVHLNYSTAVRPAMHTWIKTEDEPFSNSTIEAGFPEYHSMEWTNLLQDGITSQQIDTLNIEDASFILLSNIMNEIPYGTANKIKIEWDLLKYCKSGPIEMGLYKNPSLVKKR